MSKSSFIFVGYHACSEWMALMTKHPHATLELASTPASTCPVQIASIDRVRIATRKMPTAQQIHHQTD